MPWCDECSKFWTPSSVKPDGSCPTCGRPLARPDTPVSSPQPPDGVTEHEAKVPWHFKLLVATLALYLLWRLWQLVVAVVT